MAANDDTSWHNPDPFANLSVQDILDMDFSYDPQQLAQSMNEGFYTPSGPQGQDHDIVSQQPQATSLSMPNLPFHPSNLDLGRPLTDYGDGQPFNSHVGDPPTPPNTTHFVPQMQARGDFPLPDSHLNQHVAPQDLLSPDATPYHSQLSHQQTGAPDPYHLTPLTSPAVDAGHVQQYFNQLRQNSINGHAGTYSRGMAMRGENARSGLMPQRGTTARKRGRNEGPDVAGPVRPPRQNRVPASADAGRSLSAPGAQGRHQNAPAGNNSSAFNPISPGDTMRMGPPSTFSPVATSSPYVSTSGQAQGYAATPSTLLQMQQTPGSSGAMQFMFRSQDQPDDFSLPAPTLDRPPLSVRDDAILISNDGPYVSQTSARKTPKLNPESTPSAQAVASGMSSAVHSAVTSPTSPNFGFGTAKRGQGKSSARRSTITSPTSPAFNPKTAKRGVRGNQRNSISTGPSPAILPKVAASPAIAPLMPSSVDSNQQGQLLASHSNYELIQKKIAPGLSGITFTESLKQSVDAKKETHKDAERMRRGQLNHVIDEMTTVVPHSFMVAEAGGASADEDDEVSGTEMKGKEAATKKAGKVKAQKTPGTSQRIDKISKFKKVEVGVKYIRVLQQEALEKDAEIEKLKEENRLLKGIINDSPG
ncbi:hypothetical protein M011DRAFT_522998 [Sporormia fimetaria CBS 119925]|uniref:BHLH domain-containing protein n=1 Tax=Sporormia fimetaria CBS 119925 TaxID=1340428 RepID=A0A6A6VSD1_9PLEO|nr:hypothetical protein M011DRAFT_522998 [Sporormia fimetaria CBS 119925]